MRAPASVTIGQTIELLSGPHRVVGHTSGHFMLRNASTDECLLLDHIELFRALPPGQRVATSDEKLDKQTLSDALDGLSEDAITLIPHLQELIDGTPAVGDLARPEYDLRLPMTRRRAAKLLELEKLGIPLAERTLQRRLESYRKEGPAGLADRRHLREEAKFSRVDERVIRVLTRIIQSYAGRTATSYTAIRAELAVALADEYPVASERPGTPSVSSVERYVKQIAGDQDPTVPGAQRATAARRPKKSAFRQRLTAAPGDECQMDTTVFDAFVRMPNGEVKRPHLTILIDVRTRSIIGFNFTDGAPSGEDHALLLARTLVPHQLRPWSSWYTELSLPEMPWAPYVEGQEHRFDTHRPHIFPRRITIDNGRDYRSVVLLATCTRYGIHLTEAPPKTPTAKSHVERHFGTIKTMFTSHLPGYVGGNTQDKGDKVEELEHEDVLELRAVSELFEQWVAVVWQNRQHDGLIDPFEPGVRHTPNTMYSAAVELTGHFMMPLGEEDFIALMPREERTVQADGVEFRGRFYDSPYLAPMRLMRDANGDAVKVQVHYDPADLSQVWVLSTEDGDWITCEWTVDAGLSRPNERKMLARAATFLERSSTLNNNDAHVLAVRMRRQAAKDADRRAVEVGSASERTTSEDSLTDIEPARTSRDRLADFFDSESLESL